MVRIVSFLFAPASAAIFDCSEIIVLILLFICTCAYLHEKMPSLLDSYKTGFSGIFWKSARIGERLSPYISVICVVMAVYVLLFQLYVWLKTKRSLTNLLSFVNDVKYKRMNFRIALLHLFHFHVHKST